LKLHLYLALASSLMMWLVCWLQIGEQRQPLVSSQGLRLTVEVATVALTLPTGHAGGFVSGVNGPIQACHRFVVFSSKSAPRNRNSEIQRMAR
jgi:hypothetical protein